VSPAYRFDIALYLAYEHLEVYTNTYRQLRSQEFEVGKGGVNALEGGGGGSIE